MPRKIRVRSPDVVVLNQAFARNGCEIRFVDVAGTEPAVIFIHGAGADHAMFEHQAHALTGAGHRVVLLDLRGHGKSRPNMQPVSSVLFADDIQTLIGNLGLDRPILAGHSLGGNIAQALVRCAPDRYRGLIVMDSAWNTGRLTATERLELRLAAPGLALIPARILPRVMANASTVTDAARTYAIRAFSQLTKAEFLEVWRATVTYVDPDPSYRTPVPLSLIRGAADKTGNIATAMPAWASAEGIAEVVVPGAGHIVTQDAPAAVSGALLTFLDTIGVRR
jgi:pimeloyl-ACP methyl ester carboxylesterase